MIRNMDAAGALAVIALVVIAYVWLEERWKNEWEKWLDKFRD